MYTYVLLRFDTSGLAYQEALDLNVTRYADVDGNTLFVIPPEGDRCVLVDADPPRLPWML